MIDWRKCHNKLHTFYPSQNISRVIELRRMRWACNTHRWQRWKVHIKFWSEHQKERDHLEELGIRHKWEYRIIMDLRDVGCEDMDRIHLTSGRDHWWALVNTIMNLQVPWKIISWLSKQLFASQEGLCCMELVWLSMLITYFF